MCKNFCEKLNKMECEECDKAMLCAETLGPDIHVDDMTLTRITHPNTIADRVEPLMPVDPQQDRDKELKASTRFPNSWSWNKDSH